MPNDFETRALQKLLGLNQEMVAPMAPDFLNAMNMLPGVSGPDDQLQALIGVAPDIYGSLASLLAPPPIEAEGTTPPQIQKTGLVRPQQQLPRQAASRPAGGAIGRTEMDEKRAKLARKEQQRKAYRELEERQAKKKGKR